MKLPIFLLILLLCSFYGAFGSEDFVHACMAKMAIDASTAKVKDIVTKAAKNLGDESLFGELAFKNLNYYEIANYPDKAKDKARKLENDATNSAVAKAPSIIPISAGPLDEKVAKDQLDMKIKWPQCFVGNVNGFLKIDKDNFQCFNEYHTSSFFIDLDQNRISVNGAISPDEVKVVTDEATHIKSNLEYWKKTPSLYGFLVSITNILFFSIKH